MALIEIASNTLGSITTSIDLFDFLYSKMYSDFDQFTKQMKKQIYAICKKMREALKDSYEFKDSIPAGIENSVFETVLAHIKNRTVIREADLLLDFKIPNTIRYGLARTLLAELYSSLEFCQRNYSAWILQNSEDMLVGLKRANTKIDSIYKSITKYDSAKAHHSPPKAFNRFHFSANTVDFLGRDIEIAKLRAFCGYGEDYENADCKNGFRWWGITGEGGTGKSRLCYEFSNEMDDKGWSICFPSQHSYERLSLCSESLINNTLFV